MRDTCEGRLNNIFTEIDNGPMNALFDILIWEDGPRVRDLGMAKLGKSLGNLIFSSFPW